MPDDLQKPSRDIGKLPFGDSQEPVKEVTPPAAPAPAESQESQTPDETEVQRLKRENINVDSKPEDADVKVQLTAGDEKVLSISNATGVYDFEAENPQLVTPTAAALLVESGYCEVVS